MGFIPGFRRRNRREKFRFADFRVGSTRFCQQFRNVRLRLLTLGKDHLQDPRKIPEPCLITSIILSVQHTALRTGKVDVRRENI